MPDLLWFSSSFLYRIDLLQDTPANSKGESCMKNTIKKIIAITAVCLIAAQTVTAAPAENRNGAEIIFCDDREYPKPIKV